MMTRRKSMQDVIGFDDTLLLVIGIPIAGLIIGSILFSEMLVSSPLQFFLISFPASMVYTGIFWLFFRQVIRYYVQKFPAQEDTFKRIFFQAVTILGLYVVIKVILSFTIDPVMHELTQTSQPHQIKEVVISLIITFMILSIYEAIRFYGLLAKVQTEKAELIAENMQSQLEGLRNQIKPHFLFNSLNTLAHLIPEDPVKAESFVTKLSRVYRYVLDAPQTPLIPLAEELEFLNNYLFLVRERFGENLEISILVDTQYHTHHIIPFSLQMLIENAIKHNVISRSNPLHVEVGVDETGALYVRNNLQRKAEVLDSTKTGLANIRNRYQLVTGQSIHIRETEREYSVFLPLINVKQA